jgi:hypothetical protein
MELELDPEISSNTMWARSLVGAPSLEQDVKPKVKRDVIKIREILFKILSLAFLKSISADTFCDGRIQGLCLS